MLHMQQACDEAETGTDASDHGIQNRHLAV
jgi:hypothetical protein